MKLNNGTAGMDAPARQATAVGAAWGWGILASAALILVYALTLSWANSLAYMFDTFLAYWYWMIPLVAGFGAQMGLFTYGRALASMGGSPRASGVVASGGASVVSMLACCAHHLAEVLPLVGFAGVALFLGNYQSLFLLAGVLSNAVGISYLLGVMARHRLYAEDGKVLAPLLRLPLYRAVPYVAGLGVLILGYAVYWEVWA